MSTVLEVWHRVASERDLDGLERLLAEDVVFQSPVVHTPQAGKAITLKYLSAALLVLNNDKFCYLSQWIGQHSAVLEFSTVIQGIEINGVDIISWNDDDKITGFKVMLRPLKAVNLVHQFMGSQLAAHTAAKS